MKACIRTEPLGNQNYNDTDVSGLMEWERSNNFVKAEVNPFIDIVETLKKNRKCQVFSIGEMCPALSRTGWLDHWCLYTKKNGDKVFVSSPYADKNSTAQINAVRCFCEANDLYLQVIDSFYSPGCIAYVVTDNDSPNPLRIRTVVDEAFKILRRLSRCNADSEKLNFLKYIIKTICNYLLWKHEQSATVIMYFEHEDGQQQIKSASFGKPTSATPELFKRNQSCHVINDFDFCSCVTVDKKGRKIE